MISTLLVTKNKLSGEHYVKDVCAKEHIDLLDVTIFDQEGTVGIADIRRLQQKLYLKPLRSDSKALIFQNAQNLTIESQNALLKTLEEPPDNTSIFLIANTLEPFLPTILSRCLLIILDKVETHFSDREREETEEIMKTLLQASTSHKLYLAQTIGEKKEQALIWLEKGILLLRLHLLSLPKIKNDEDTNEYISLIQSFQEAYKIIKTTNVSPRFTLENLFLNL